MKKILLTVMLASSLVTTAYAYNVNGQYFLLLDCRYEYNLDFAEAGYVGTYRAISGKHYSWFFPTSDYNWCPN